MAILPHKCTIYTRIQRTGSILLLKHPFYDTFTKFMTSLRHVRQVYHTFYYSNPLKPTQTHSNPFKPPFYYTFHLNRTILLHKSQIYDTFTIIRTRLLHIYHLTRPSMRLASQNQEIGAKKKSRFMGPIPGSGYQPLVTRHLDFKARDLFWAKIFYWLKRKVNNF